MPWKNGRRYCMKRLLLILDNLTALPNAFFFTLMPSLAAYNYAVLKPKVIIALLIFIGQITIIFLQYHNTYYKKQYLIGVVAGLIILGLFLVGNLRCLV